MSWFGGNKEKTENRYIKGPLEIERDALVIKLNKQIDIQAKTNEQVNLLRFKVEVLVEMLAMEEKKYETTAKRLEALKWAYELQTTKLNDASGKGALSNTADEMSSPLSDIHGAMARLSEEFSKNSSGIVIRFADDKGQLASSLSKSEFVHTLMTIASSQVSPADCEVRKVLLCPASFYCFSVLSYLYVVLLTCIGYCVALLRPREPACECLRIH